jgi:antitoxin PrlF
MNEQTTGVRLAERMLTSSGGATMDEIVAATGGPQYNLLRRLEARGYAIRKVKEGRATRYFARAPDTTTLAAAVTSKGQITVPRDVRDALRLVPGDTVEFSIDPNGAAIMKRKARSIRDLFGILGKPSRSLTVEQMDESIKEAAVNRFLRATGKKRR